MAKLQLVVGAFGDEVKNLHRNLLNCGLAVPSSELERAFFGPSTRNAVMQWQRTHGLPATGIVDEQTKATLETAPQPTPVQTQGPAPVAPPRTVSLDTADEGIFGPEIKQTFFQARDAAAKQTTRNVTVNGTVVPVPYPFLSPIDWRDCWMYFLMVDRFANTQAPPKHPWNQQFDYRQGGTFTGVTAQLNYLQDLGVKALWLSPVLKNPRPDWQYNYHGYNTQDFLHVDERFGSDGTRGSAERELADLIAQAHGRGIYVILDIVLNHAARVFDYVYKGQVVDKFDDPDVMNAPLGQEPPIQWLNGYGFPRADWQDQIPPDARLSPDDAVYPVDLQEKTFFRRRGNTLSYALSPEGFVKGDFVKQRQLVV
jgi:hypothetical protein